MIPFPERGKMGMKGKERAEGSFEWQPFVRSSL